MPAQPPIPPPPVIYLGRNLESGGAERVMVHYLNGARLVEPIGVLLDARGPLLTDVRMEVPLHDLSHRPAEVPTGLRSAGCARGPPSIEKWKIVREARRLAVLTRRTRARLISSFLMRSHMVALLARELWCRDVRLVFNVHSMPLQSEAHLYPDPLSRHTMRAFLRRGFPRADAVITVSRGVTDELVGFVPGLRERVTELGNPIDIETVRAGAGTGPRLPDVDGALVAAVGRMIPLKGFDLLLDAIAILDPERRPSIVFVGDGPQRPALAAQARRLGLAHKVHMVGHVPNPWGYMAQADVVVLSSRTEAFPNVIGEALAVGTPVVATACAPGVEQYLDHGGCGILVPTGDPAALATGILRVLGDEALRGRLSGAGRDRVERLGITSVVRGYEDLLIQTIHG